MARRSIQGMRILITGASSGIGLALAEELAACGARLVLNARRSEALAEICRRLGPRHEALPGDVGSDLDRAALIEAAFAGGRLDAIVCNAGVGLYQRVEETSAAAWRELFEINLLGSSELMRLATPRLRAQEPRQGWRGHFVVVSSGLARRAMPDCAAYCASKAAQLSLCESARIELAADAIAVTSVHPVRTATNFSAASIARSGRTRQVEGSMPSQDAATVARAMRRAIERPRPEVWPHAGSRWLCLLAAAWPGLADAVFRKRYARV